MASKKALALLSIAVLSASAVKLAAPEQPKGLLRTHNLLQTNVKSCDCNSPASGLVEGCDCSNHLSLISLRQEGDAPAETTNETTPAATTTEAETAGETTETTSGEATTETETAGGSTEAAPAATTTETETAEGSAEAAPAADTEAEPTVIDDALATETPAATEEPATTTAEPIPPEEDNRGLLTKVLDFVKSKVFGREPAAAETTAAPAANANQSIPDANELGTGITDEDFYRIAELVAPNGPGTIAYHESVNATETESGPANGPVYLPVPFTPKGRNIGAYTEKIDELSAIVQESPFIDEEKRAQIEVERQIDIAEAEAEAEAEEEEQQNAAAAIEEALPEPAPAEGTTETAATAEGTTEAAPAEGTTETAATTEGTTEAAAAESTTEATPAEGATEATSAEGTTEATTETETAGGSTEASPAAETTETAPAEATF